MKNDPMLLWTAVWVIAAAVALLRHWQRQDMGVGLMIAYVMSFGALYWIAPAFQLLPWYDGAFRQFTIAGIRQSALAMAAFAVGAEMAGQISRLLNRRRK